MATAGRILIIPKGDYNASTTYEMLDLVNYNGIPYLAKKTAVGIAPTNAEYWHPMIGLSIANNLETTTEGYVLDARQGKAIMDLLATKVTKTLIWSGSPIAKGSIDCTEGPNYDEFEIYCNDGCVLKGCKVYNASKGIYQIQCGYSGLIDVGASDPGYAHGSYIGLIDIYETHLFLHTVELLVIHSNDVVTGKTIYKIYGIS